MISLFLLCCRPYGTTERIFIWDKKIWNWLSTHASTICMILIKPLWWTSLWSISNLTDLLHRCPLPDSSELCLPAKISHLLCLIHHQFSPLNMCVCIILSYGHSQPDWCQLIFKWPCCKDRKSRPCSSVWVPWPLFCQFLLPDLNIIPLLDPHSDSSSLFPSVNMEYRQTHVSALGSRSWHLLCCSVTSWSGNGSKITLQNPYLFLIRRSSTDSILSL